MIYNNYNDEDGCYFLDLVVSATFDWVFYLWKNLKLSLSQRCRC